MTVFFRTLEVEIGEKAKALETAVRGRGAIFDVQPSAFAELPGSPFAYWASAKVRAVFRAFPQFETTNRIARKGLTTSNDERYVRVWWEPAEQDLIRTWSTYAKGGIAQKFWSPLHTVVRWDATSRTIPGYCGRAGRESSKVECAELMGNPGLTWPLRAASFSPSALPSDAVFSARGYTIQAPRNELLCLLAITASTAFDTLFKLCLGRSGHPEFIVGILQRLPLPAVGEEESASLGGLARRAWSLRRSLDVGTEISRAFVLPALLQVDGLDFAERAAAYATQVVSITAELAGIQCAIDDACYLLYGIDGEDRRRIEDGYLVAKEAPVDDEGSANEFANSDQVDTVGHLAGLLSWAVGVAFGRFDVRLATEDREPPPEPEPFDPLPVCSLGMLTGEDGLPVEVPPSGYPIDFPSDGVLADDAGHDRDLVSRMRQVFELVFGGKSDAAWLEATEILDARTRDVRGWVARSFFEHHIKRYSKSRRKAPIYWQLSSPSASYSVWLYVHRFTRDTLYKVLNDFVEPKLRHEERKLASFAQEVGGSPTSGQRKQIDAHEHFVEELRSFRDEVARVAPLWNPNLDDGVIINFAPLWRLVPHHRAWQKECKKVWDKLCKGEYDWAHLAMHLWPERVVPKCREDRSLAIAHGLEDVFWQEDSDGKWKPRNVDSGTIDRLVADRSSAAVKDALESLLNAPAPAALKDKRRRPRKSKARRPVSRDSLTAERAAPATPRPETRHGES